MPAHKDATPKLKPLMGPTVWHEFTPLSQKHKAVNLGQGFPDWTPPPFVTQANEWAVGHGGHDQYARSAGHPELTAALSRKYSPLLGHEVDPMSEVCVSVGASQTLYTAIGALCGPGDEVILIEPAFDIYGPQITMAGATPVYIPLVRTGKSGTAGDWTLDMDRFRAAMGTGKVRAVILNTPHNPAGKVFTREELTVVSEAVLATERCVVISDEVYEELVFDGREMVRIASLPGMFDRTVTISSAGKTFSVTGWKVGWAIGPAEIIAAISGRHQWMCFSVSTTAQVALSKILDSAEDPYEGFDSYYDWLRDLYTRKRDHLVGTLRRAGLDPIVPEGSFFVLANTSKAAIPQSYLDAGSRDYAFCRWLTVDVGVTAIPPSAFYCDEDKPIGHNYARFAFCKNDKSLQDARVRILKVLGDSENRIDEEVAAAAAAAAAAGADNAASVAVKRPGDAASSPSSNSNAAAGEEESAAKRARND